MRCSRFLFVVLVLAGIFAGCQRAVERLDAPEKLTLYSLDGRAPPTLREEKTGESFHGYPVWGKVEIEDAEKRREIVAAIKQGMAESDGHVRKCFWPHHGIRAVENGETVDLVICFFCQQLESHRDGRVEEEITISKSPQSLLNQTLEEANLPLPPLMPGEAEAE